MIINIREKTLTTRTFLRISSYSIDSQGIHYHDKKSMFLSIAILWQSLVHLSKDVSGQELSIQILNQT